MIRAGPVVAALILALASPAAAHEVAENDTEAVSRDGDATWWAVFSLYGASLALTILGETHKQPCEVPGCDPARRGAYIRGAAATAAAGVSLDLWRSGRARQSVVFGAPDRRGASIGYRLAW